jgi:hypothetical protein
MTVPRRFAVLRFFGTLLKVIAWIVLVVSVLGAVAAVLAGASPQVANILSGFMPADGAALMGAGGGIVLAIMLLIGGLLYFLVLYVAGESLHLQLAVEENTRLTAALLLRMHQEGQTDATPNYGAGGGFINEPYET